MRYIVKALYGDKEYVIYRTDDIDNASAFAEGYYIKNDFHRVWVTRLGSLDILKRDNRPLLWERPRASAA